MSWAPDAPTSEAAPPRERSPMMPYRLLMSVPDLRSTQPRQLLGTLRVNWRRRDRGSPQRWRRIEAWCASKPFWAIAATVLALLAITWAATQLGVNKTGHQPANSVAAEQPRKLAKESPKQPDPSPSVVRAGYQTASERPSPASRQSQVTASAQSLFTLRPTRLSGTIESLEAEGAR